jgi:hypothetical protein
MTISMYKASVPIFVQFLTSLSAWLDKAAAYAEAKKIDPAVLLNTRFFPDMFPLARQVRAATDHAINACGRLAGVELPTFANTEASIPELEERVAKDNRLHQGDQVGADRWQRGQGDHDEICERRAQVLRAVAVAELLPAELLFSRHDCLRHPASERRRARQAGLHGNAAPALAGTDAPHSAGLNLEATYEQSALSRYHSRRLWRQPIATHRLVRWTQPRRTPAIGGNAATRW